MLKSVEAFVVIIRNDKNNKNLLLDKKYFLFLKKIVYDK